MAKIQKRYLAAFLLILCTGMVGYGFLAIKSRKIEHIILAQLDDLLVTSFSVDQFNVDFLSAFPMVHVKCSGVRLDGTDQKPFVTLTALAFRLNPIRGILEQPRIASVSLQDGTISIRRTKSGDFNYQVFAQDSGSERDFWLTLQRANLKDVLITYADHTQGISLRTIIQSGEIGVGISPFQIRSGLDMTLSALGVTTGGNTFRKSGPFALTGHVEINPQNNIYRFEEVAIKDPDLSVLIAGMIHQHADHTAYQLEFDIPRALLENIPAMLPDSVQNALAPFQCTGTLHGSGSIRGRMSESENPAVLFDLQVREGQMFATHYGEAIDFDLESTFSNGMMRSMQTTLLEIPKLSGSYKGHPFIASASMRGFLDPQLDLAFQGTLPVSLPGGMVPDQEITNLSGIAHIDQFEVQDLWLNHLDFTDLSNVRGQIQLERIRCNFKGKPLAIDSGAFAIANGNVAVDTLQMQWGASGIHASGNVRNVSLALQSRQTDHLEVALQGRADNLVLHDFIKPVFARASGAENAIHRKSVALHTSSDPSLPLPGGTCRLAIDHLEYGSLRFENMTAELQSTGDAVDFDVSGESLSGAFDAEGILTHTASPRLDMKLHLDNVQVGALFEEYHAFGQALITDRHIDGELDARLLVHTEWNHQWDLNKDQLDIAGGVSVRNGTLKNVEMLERFSKYIHLEDLQHIRFERLDNFFEVRNGHLYLPVMFIQSNALNLTVNGVHSLENKILYNLKINAGQVIANKVRRHQPGLRPVPARKNGTFNLYYSIYGDLDTYEMLANKAAILSSFRQSARMRDGIRSELREAFGVSIDMIEPESWQDIEHYELQLEKGPDTFLDIK